MSATSVKLLHAAAQVVGGSKALAERLGITETLLTKFMADTLELPDPLLLRALDVLHAERQVQPPPAAQSPRESVG